LRNASIVNAWASLAAPLAPIFPISRVFVCPLIGSRANTITAGLSLFVILNGGARHLIVFGLIMLIGKPSVLFTISATDVIGAGITLRSSVGPRTWK
jgi:hypothetical protein